MPNMPKEAQSQILTHAKLRSICVINKTQMSCQYQTGGLHNPKTKAAINDKRKRTTGKSLYRFLDQLVNPVFFFMLLANVRTQLIRIGERLRTIWAHRIFLLYMHRFDMVEDFDSACHFFPTNATGELARRSIGQDEGLDLVVGQLSQNGGAAYEETESRRKEQDRRANFTPKTINGSTKQK